MSLSSENIAVSKDEVNDILRRLDNARMMADYGGHWNLSNLLRDISRQIEDWK